jgi:hypothetical protein
MLKEVFTLYGLENIDFLAINCVLSSAKYAASAKNSGSVYEVLLEIFAETFAPHAAEIASALAEVASFVLWVVSGKKQLLAEREEYYHLYAKTLALREREKQRNRLLHATGLFFTQMLTQNRHFLKSAEAELAKSFYTENPSTTVYIDTLAQLHLALIRLQNYV